MHQIDFETALSEIKSGKKESHWMWYIFPQIHGLGTSSTAQYYAIRSTDEARAFLADDYLCNNLVTICNALLNLESSNAVQIFGFVDTLKMKSSMTLFAYVSEENSVFDKVLEKYFNGTKDSVTLRIIGAL